MDLRDTSRTATRHNLGRKINFVVRWPDAGTELHEKVFRLRPKTLAHQPDRFGGDAEIGALSAGMHQADRGPHRVDQVERTAISHVNPEADILLISDQPVAGVETLIACHGRIDDTDPTAMDLLRAGEGPRAQAEGAAHRAVHVIKPLEGLRFVRLHIDAADTRGEAVLQPRPRVQRRELFRRKFTCLHPIESC